MTSILVALQQFADILRPVFFGAFVVVGAVCVADWAVRTRRLNPFGGIARFMRARVDPLLAPIERQLVLRGGQPHTAPWWALGAVVLGGILFLALVDFVIGALASAAYATTAGPSGVLRLTVMWGTALLQFALIVRVLGSWFGQTRYSRWTSWSYKLTDWIIEPLRRVIPNLGMIDITPLVAYFALSILRALLLSAL